MFYNNKNMKFQIIITITVLLMTTVSLYLAVMSIPLPVWYSELGGCIKKDNFIFPPREWKCSHQNNNSQLGSWRT